MSVLRVVGRGLRDLYDQLLIFCVLSVFWWICQITIVFGPPATLALFAMADPRRQVSTPEFREAFSLVRANFRRSWGIFLCSAPLIVILVLNILSFAGSDHWLRALVPLWTIMTFFLVVIFFYSFSVSANMDSGVRNAFRGAMFVLVSKPFQSILLFLILFVLLGGMLFTIILGLLIVPAAAATIINRMVLRTLDVYVPDPNSLTDERADEKERGIAPDKGPLSWIRPGGGGNRRKGNR